MNDVDYDDRNDPDTPKSGAAAVCRAISFVGAIDNVIVNGDTTILTWARNYEEQIEAHLARMGWEVRRTRPWK